MKKIKPKQKKNNIEYRWIITITLLAYIISLALSFISETTIPNASSIVAIIVILIFIGIGIIFDMIGVAITVANIDEFNSMASRQVKGSKLAVKLIKNSEKAASFCNDVIGDICGVISGSAGIALATIISKNLNISIFGITLIITSIIASLTIGGKALGKTTAIAKSTSILSGFTKILSIFYRK